MRVRWGGVERGGVGGIIEKTYYMRGGGVGIIEKKYYIICFLYYSPHPHEYEGESGEG
jgi:hypothetical protein